MTPTLASRRLELAVEVAEGAGTIIGDSDQLDRVFINLLSNAVKFTPDGGRISLRVWRERASVSIVVADNGIGVPAEEQSRLFQRFYRSSIATEMPSPAPDSDCSSSAASWSSTEVGSTFARRRASEPRSR